jgi:hypothetical protein
VRHRVPAPAAPVCGVSMIRTHHCFSSSPMVERIPCRARPSSMAPFLSAPFADMFLTLRVHPPLLATTPAFWHAPPTPLHFSHPRVRPALPASGPSDVFLLDPFVVLSNRRHGVVWDFSCCYLALPRLPHPAPSHPQLIPLAGSSTSSFFHFSRAAMDSVPVIVVCQAPSGPLSPLSAFSIIIL